MATNTYHLYPAEQRFFPPCSFEFEMMQKYMIRNIIYANKNVYLYTQKNTFILLD